MRDCNGCTECCTAIPVEPLGKGADQKCKYDTGRACRIYGNRPNCCREFSCAWREGVLPKAHRPDITGVVCWPTILIGTKGEKAPVIRATVRPGVRRVHRQTMNWLRNISSQYPVQVELGGVNRLWQDGEQIAKWNNDDFINMEITGGKFSNPKVIPRGDVLATDEDEREWEETQEMAKLVRENKPLNIDKIRAGEDK